MLRKSNISLSNRAVFYSSKKDILQPPEQSQNLNVVKRDLYKQKIATSSLPKWRYTRVRVRSQSFEDADQPNKSNVNSVIVPLLSERTKGWPRRGLKEEASTTPANNNDHNLASLVLSRSDNPKMLHSNTLSRVFSKVLQSNPKDISVQWLERLGFTFSPFAFIFGTTFLFAALASTLQKQDGRPWLATLSHTKLPGLTDNKVRQRSSWVFLEGILSQYIKRDSSFLISTPSLLQEVPYSAQLQKAVPRTLTLSRLKPTTGIGELESDLEIQLSPMWSQHIKKDFLGVFPLRRYSDGPNSRTTFTGERSSGLLACLFANRRFAPEGLQPKVCNRRFAPEAALHSVALPERSSGYPRLALHSEAVQRSSVGPLHSEAVQGLGFQAADLHPKVCSGPMHSEAVQGLCKLEVGSGIWPWYKIMAYHPANRPILPTWTDYTTSELKAGVTDHSIKQLKVSSDQLSPDDSIVKQAPEQKSFDFVRLVRRRFAKGTIGTSDNSPRSPFRKIQTVAESLRRETEFAQAPPFDKYVERLRLGDDSIPSKKESVYSSSATLSIVGETNPLNKIHVDTLSARVLTVVKKSFYEYGLSIPNSCSALPRREPLSINSPICLTTEHPEDVDKLVNSVTARTELRFAPSGYQNFTKIDPLGALQTFDCLHSFAVQPKVCKQELRSGTNAVRPEQSRPLHVLDKQSGRTQKLRFCKAEEGTEQVPAAAQRSGAKSSRKSQNSGDGLFSSTFSKQTRSSCKTKPNLSGVLSVSDQFESLRETAYLNEESLTKQSPSPPEQTGGAPILSLRLSKAGWLSAWSALTPSKRSDFANRRLATTVLYRRGQVSDFSENGTQSPLICYAKSGGLSLNFRNLAIPKKSFWEYAHTLSGYKFPELQDYEVTDLFRKVSASSKSKVGLVTRLCEAGRTKLGPSSYLANRADNKQALFSPGGSSSGLDTNQVFLTPYLVKVPPQVLVTASNKTEGRNLLSRLNKTVPYWPEQPGVVPMLSSKRSKTGMLAPAPTVGKSKSLPFALQGGAVAEHGLANRIFAADRPPARIANAQPSAEQGRFGGPKESRVRPLEEHLKVRYTPLELEQENKIKKAFKVLGRDYSDYLRQPKDSLPALLLSPSLEEDKLIEEEEAQRLAHEKAAARAAAKRPHNDEDEKDSLIGPYGTQEFNTINPNDVALGERKKGDSNLEEEPLNDEDIEDSRFERLRFTREIEAKKEEEDCRGLALSFTCHDSTAPVISLARARYPFRPFYFAANRRFAAPLKGLGPEGLDMGLRLHKLAGSTKPAVGAARSCEFVPSNPLEAPGVSNRKHSFFGQKSFSPTRIFSQEERLVSAHIVKPFIRLEQRNPWLIRGFSEPCSAFDPYGANQNSVTAGSAERGEIPIICPTKRADISGPSGPAEKLSATAEPLLGQEEQAAPFKIDELLTLKNLQTQARLGFIRFIHLPVVEAASRNAQSRALWSQVKPGSFGSANSLSLNNGSANILGLFGSAEQAQETKDVAKQDLDSFTTQSQKGAPTLNKALQFEELQSTHPGQSVTRKTGNHNRIYKPDLRLRVTSLESSISADWRNERKAESSPFRVTSKERPHIVLPQLSENEWQKSLEWQLKSHFIDEDTRLEPLLANEPSKTFKVKRITRSIPWLTLAKPSFKHFEWPYKTVGVLSAYNDGRDLALANRKVASATTPGESAFEPHTGVTGTPFRQSEAVHAYRRFARVALQHQADACTPLPGRSHRSDLVNQRFVTPVLQGLQNLRFCKATVPQNGTKTRLNNSKVCTGLYKTGNQRLQISELQAPMLSSKLRKVSDSGFAKPVRVGLLTAPLLSETGQAHERLLNYSRIPLAGTFTTYSKDRSSLSGSSSQLFGRTNKIFNSQEDFNTERLFEPPSASSWFLIYRLFLALILKEVFKYIYRISLKDFFIRIINSDFGRTITSPEFRQSVQFEPFPEFYKPRNRLKDLIGIKNALLPLSEIIWFLRNNCRSRSGPHGVVLLGPDGVDTTAIAQAVAGEAKVPIIVQSLRALTLTHSHPQKRLEKVLHLARAQSPCVLFLDELDAIGQSREGVIRNTSGDGNSLISLDSSKMSTRIPTQLQPLDDQTTSQGRRVDLMLRLLTVMDGLHHLNGVVIITTSKNTATLDPALLRPGRFDRLIHLTLPNPEHRMELFKVKTRELGHTDQMPWEYLSLRTENMGGTDILSAINYSIIRAIVNDTVHTVETLEYGLNCVKALKDKQVQTRYTNYSY